MNHLDGRRCPDCGAAVHGWEGQNEHQRFHDELADLLQRLMDMAGVEQDEDTEAAQWTLAEGEEEG